MRANGLTDVWTLFHGFIADKTVASVGGSAGAVQTNILANRNAMVQQRLVALVTGAGIGGGAIAIATTSQTDWLASVGIFLTPHVTLMTLANIGSNTKAIHAILFANRFTTHGRHLFIPLMTFTESLTAAEAIFTIYTTGLLAFGAGAIHKDITF